MTNMNTTVDVAVIGAGSAGIGAAKTLRAQGSSIIVLEASAVPVACARGGRQCAWRDEPIPGRDSLRVRVHAPSESSTDSQLMGIRAGDFTREAPGIR